ncbi:MAG: glycoside hydrolase family 16 protein [Anaerolineae bacterium]
MNMKARVLATLIVVFLLAALAADAVRRGCIDCGATALWPAVEAGGAPEASVRSASSSPLPTRRDGRTADWSLVFDDEFNGVLPDGTGLDTGKWVTCYWYAAGNGADGCGDEGAQSWYMPQNAVVSGGSLHLISRRETVTGTDGTTYPYTSGMITSGRIGSSGPAKFEFRYGYVEVRARVPATKGFWPSVWCLTQSGDYPFSPLPEIDIAELQTFDPGTVYMTYHGPDGANVLPQGYGAPANQPDFSGGYHIFAAEWSPGQVIWYVDGVERRRYDDPRIAAVPMHLLLTMGVGSLDSWAGGPDDSTQFPSEFQVDYVRVWQRSAGAAPEPPPPLLVSLQNDLAYYDTQFRELRGRVSAKLAALRLMGASQ